jgi:hypothetical protein
MMITVFWDVMLCSLADVTSTSEEPAASIFTVEASTLKTEATGSLKTPDYTTSHPRQQ